MKYEISKGIVETAKKCVVYGPEGIGKSTFVSQFSDPLFIDTEGSTKNLDVKRLPKPTSWQMLIDEVKDVIQERPCQTLVIDTADWAERLCVEAICAKHGKNGIEDFGYGNGYTYVAEEWGRFLNLLQDVVDNASIHVVLTAHSIIRKFEQPNEMGSYDRYELKLGKKTTAQTAPLTKEWADIVLFVNYKTMSVQVDDKGKKHKAQGGKRVMYTTHHPCWDAKNRYGLAEELDMEYVNVANIFEKQQQSYQQPRPQVEIKEAEVKPSIDVVENDDKISIQLLDLMKVNGVLKEEVMDVVTKKGYYPSGTPIENYGIDFIEGVLVGAWDKVFAEIKESRKESNLEF